MKKILLTTLATCSIGQAAIITQTFSNNSLGTINNGNSASLTATPNFTPTQVSNATELTISFSFTGAAHMFIQSLDAGGRQHDADLLTQMTFTQIDHLIDVNSLQLMSINANPSIPGNGSIDTTAGSDNPMTYTAQWTTTDTATIANINGSSLSFTALPVHELGFDSQVNQDFGGATYSNIRLEDSSFQTSFGLTTSVPEPSSSLLLSVSTLGFLLRRKR